MYDAVETPVSEQSNLEFYTYFSKKSLFVETSTAIFTSIDDAKCSICECIKCSSDDIVSVGNFLVMLSIFQSDENKKCCSAKLRMIGLPVVTILVALMQILAIANLWS